MFNQLHSFDNGPENLLTKVLLMLGHILHDKDNDTDILFEVTFEVLDNRNP